MLRCEQEVTITFSMASPVARVYASTPAMIKRLAQLANMTPEATVVYMNQPDGYHKGDILIEVPRKWIKIKPPRKMSAEQRQTLSERAARMWSKKRTEKC